MLQAIFIIIILKRLNTKYQKVTQAGNLCKLSEKSFEKEKCLIRFNVITTHNYISLKPYLFPGCIKVTNARQGFNNGKSIRVVLVN